MVAPFPSASVAAAAPDAERDMAILIQVITTVRTIRGEMHIAPGQTLEVIVWPSPDHGPVLEAHRALVEGLARARVTLDPGATRPPGSALGVVGRSELYVKLEGIVDFAGERVRLDKEVRRANEQITFLESKLGRADFVERAPADVVAKERERLEEQRRLKAKLEASLASIDEGRG
jgi:valyl-tRNA synthetase